MSQEKSKTKLWDDRGLITLRLTKKEVFGMDKKRKFAFRNARMFGKRVCNECFEGFFYLGEFREHKVTTGHMLPVNIISEEVMIR